MMLGLDGPAAMAGPYATQRNKKANVTATFIVAQAMLEFLVRHFPSGRRSDTPRATTSPMLAKGCMEFQPGTPKNPSGRPASRNSPTFPGKLSDHMHVRFTPSTVNFSRCHGSSIHDVLGKWQPRCRLHSQPFPGQGH